MENQIKGLMKQVRRILELSEKSRNNDKSLGLNLWRLYYAEKIKILPSGETYVLTSDIMGLPSMDYISRCRRKIQEGGEYLPTSWEVAERRGIAEGEWRNYMLNN